MGVCQVMEGRHCFQHLTVEENLLTGAFTRKIARGRARRATSSASTTTSRGCKRAARRASRGYTSGGEQQMTAIGRALMARPKMILLDEPSMGLAPQIVEEIFEIVRDLNQQGAACRSCSPSRTRQSRCATPTTATSSRTAAS